jgi:transcriptional regulator with XRE-family HTH domain
MPESSRPTDLFPERLRLARQKRELSQEALAKRANLQPSAVSHFETGTRKPSFDNLRRIADALDVTTDYLLGRVDEMQDVAGGDRLHRHLDQLTTADREIAKDFLEMLAKRRSQSEDQ